MMYATSYQLPYPVSDMALPLIIILFFTFIPLLIGSAAYQHSTPTISDFFIYNRNMSTTLCFFTVYATWWSSFAFLGSTSYFYSVGSVYWTAIGWNILFGLLYMWFGSRINRYGKELGYVTPTHFFSDIFQSKIVSVFVLVVMIVFTIPYLQIQLYGGAIIIEIATQGMIPWQICAFIFYVIMVIYLWTGGLRAVAWADIFYGPLTFFGMVLSGYLLVSAAGGVGSIFETLAKNRPDLLLLTDYIGSSSMSMWVSMFLIMPLGALMGPAMWTRMFCAKKQASFHIMPFLLTLATIAYLGSMLAGSAAVILKPDVVSSDTILPILLGEYAPMWLMATIMCCGAAACLSTANSELHAISALVSLDIYKRYLYKHASEKSVILIAKITILAFSAIAYLVLILADTPTYIVNTGFTALCGMAQITVPTVGALLWRRSNPTGVVLGLAIGIATPLACEMMKVEDLFLHPGLIGLLLNAAVFISCGMLLPINQMITEKIISYKKGLFH